MEVALGASRVFLAQSLVQSLVQTLVQSLAQSLAQSLGPRALKARVGSRYPPQPLVWARQVPWACFWSPEVGRALASAQPQYLTRRLE